jgi:hypothetical protein
MQLLVPALNSMIDITTTRAMAASLHTPAPLFLALIAIAIGCALMVGAAVPHGAATDHLRLWGFSIVIALATSIIIDLEFPRLGFITLTDFEATLITVASL